MNKIKMMKLKSDYADKAADFAEDYKSEVLDIKDTVVGTVKEKTGQLKDDKILILKGKLQRAKADNGVPTKVLTSLGILAAITCLICFLLKKDE